MYKGKGLPNKEKKPLQTIFAQQLPKFIWSYGAIPTKFVGYIICKCCQQHILSSLLSQPWAAAVVVCRRASYISTPRMGAGPAYSGNTIN